MCMVSDFISGRIPNSQHPSDCTELTPHGNRNIALLIESQGGIIFQGHLKQFLAPAGKWKPLWKGRGELQCSRGILVDSLWRDQRKDYKIQSHMLAKETLSVWSQVHARTDVCMCECACDICEFLYKLLHDQYQLWNRKRRNKYAKIGLCSMLCPSLRDHATTHSTLSQDKEEFINRRGEQKYPPLPFTPQEKFFPTNALKNRWYFFAALLGDLRVKPRSLLQGTKGDETPGGVKISMVWVV